MKNAQSKEPPFPTFWVGAFIVGGLLAIKIVGRQNLPRPLFDAESAYRRGAR